MMTTAEARYRSGAMRMEWRKLRTVRSTWLILALFAAGVLGYATLVGAGGPTQSDPGYDPTDNVLQGLLIGQLTLGILGALTLSGEFGSGSIRATFAAVPRRGRVRQSAIASAASDNLCPVNGILERWRIITLLP